MKRHARPVSRADIDAIEAKIALYRTVMARGLAYDDYRLRVGMAANPIGASDFASFPLQLLQQYLAPRLHLERHGQFTEPVPRFYCPKEKEKRRFGEYMAHFRLYIAQSSKAGTPVDPQLLYLDLHTVLVRPWRHTRG